MTSELGQVELGIAELATVSEESVAFLGGAGIWILLSSTGTEFLA